MVSAESAWKAGVKAYWTEEQCPYTYDDLHHSWWSGWFNALVAVADMNVLSIDVED